MRILCTAKDSHIFSTKNNSVFVTLADICLTNLCLNDIVKANDALNNWVLITSKPQKLSGLSLSRKNGLAKPPIQIKTVGVDLDGYI